MTNGKPKVLVAADQCIETKTLHSFNLSPELPDIYSNATLSKQSQLAERRPLLLVTRSPPEDIVTGSRSLRPL